MTTLPRGQNDTWALPIIEYNSAWLTKTPDYVYSSGLISNLPTRYALSTNITNFKPIIYSDSGNETLIIGYRPFISTDINYLYIGICSAVGGGMSYTSSNGINMTAQTILPEIASQNIIYNSVSNLFIMGFYLSTNWWISTSPDGITWTIRVTYTPVPVSYVYFEQNTDGSVIVAVDDSGGYPSYSLDGGLTWILSTTLAQGQALCYSDEQAMFVLSGGSLGQIFYSYNGIVWMLSSTTGVINSTGLIYVPSPISRYYIVSGDRNGRPNYEISSFLTPTTDLITGLLSGSNTATQLYANLLYIPESDRFLTGTSQGVAYSTKVFNINDNISIIQSCTYAIDIAQRYTNFGVGNNITGNGTLINPFQTIGRCLTGAQYPLEIQISGQSSTENLSLVGSNSNMSIMTLDTISGQQTNIVGTITTSSTMTKLRLNGFIFNNTTQPCLTIGDTLGRHIIQNISFISSAVFPITFTSNFTNWIDFYDCDMTGLVGGCMILPNLTGTAICRLYDCGVVRIKVGDGWTVYLRGSTVLSNLSTISSTSIIIQLPLHLYISVITSQSQFNDISTSGLYLNNFGSLTGLSYATSGCSILRSGSVNTVNLPFNSLPPSVSVLNGTRYDTWVKNVSTNTWYQLNPLQLSGGTMTGDIDLGTNNIIGTTGLIQGFNVPTLDTRITTAQTAATDALPKSGGTMTGDIDLGTNNITAVDDITANRFIVAGGTNIQYLLADGSLLTQSANSGNSNFFLYNNINATISPPLTSGQLKFNNASQSLTTVLYISILTRDGIDISIYFSQLSILNSIYIQQQTGSNNYIQYSITSEPSIIGASYVQIPVSMMSSAGTGSTTFGNTTNIMVSIFTNSLAENTRITNLETKTQNQTATLTETTFSNPISLTTNKITSSYVPLANDDLTNRLYVDGFLPKTGGTMTGSIALGTNNITGTTGLIQGFNIPALDTRITTAQTTATDALPKTGGTMTGSIITNSATAINLNGTITGNVYPTNIDTYQVGSSTLPYLSSEVSSMNTKNIILYNPTRTFSTTISAANTESTTLVLPKTQGAASTFLQNNGSGNLSWATASGGGGGTPSNVQTFITSGTQTYTPTAGTTRAMVIVQGGGGGGGGTGTANSNNACGSGGNAGASYIGYFAIDDTKVGTIVIGTGGAGGGREGTTGIASTFLFPSTGTLSGKITANGGVGGGYRNSSGAGTSGTGSDSNQYIVSIGALTLATATVKNAVFLGGYGSQSEPGILGMMVAADFGASGAGGTSIFGGRGLSRISTATGTNLNGLDAIAYTGSGGGGAIQTIGSFGAIGGNGAMGIVYVVEYY